MHLPDMIYGRKRSTPRSAAVVRVAFSRHYWQPHTRPRKPPPVRCFQRLLPVATHSPAEPTTSVLFPAIITGNYALAPVSHHQCAVSSDLSQHGVPPIPNLTDVLRKLASGGPDAHLHKLLSDHWHTWTRPRPDGRSPPPLVERPVDHSRSATPATPVHLHLGSPDAYFTGTFAVNVARRAPPLWSVLHVPDVLPDIAGKVARLTLHPPVEC